MSTNKRPAEDEAEQQSDKKKRLPKKKVAMLCAFVGTGFCGFQRNKGVLAVEDALETALHKAGAISDDNVGDLTKSAWGRAARTDKGVHAAGQIVSLKILDQPYDLVAAANEHLPPTVRVLGFHRVTSSFHAKTSCSGRRYEYVCPSFAFGPKGTGTHHVRHLQTLGQELIQDDEEDGAESDEESSKPKSKKVGKVPELSEVKVSGVSDDQGRKPVTLNQVDITPPEVLPEDGLAKHNEFRLSAESLKLLNQLLAFYQGTHNFHNFTTHRKSDDPSCRRFMVEIKCHEPFMVGDVEYVKLTFEGQSFMLHQIRKMVGMMVGVMRGNLPKEMMFAALLVPNHRIKDIPTAPGYSLLLDYVNYERYNSIHGAVHSPLTFDDVADKKQDFKNNLIYPHIHQYEQQTLYMARWLHTLDLAQINNIPRYVQSFVDWRSESKAASAKVTEAMLTRLRQVNEILGEDGQQQQPKLEQSEPQTTTTTTTTTPTESES